jgi:hypothetical protein
MKPERLTNSSLMREELGYLEELEIPIVYIRNIS